MSSTIGEIIKTTVFGESHGVAIGAVIDALPAGYKIDIDEIKVQTARRAPGQTSTATARKETDEPKFLSGLLDGVTTGAPLAFIIENNDQRSHNYDGFKDRPRPSHADYAAYVRYNGHNDIRGGGNFSGRLTAPLTVAGAVARQILKQNSIVIGGHVLGVGSSFDEPFDPVNVSCDLLENLNKQYFSVINNEVKQKMTEEIAEVKNQGDSIGGEIEIAVIGLPAGIGSPTARGIENVVSNAVFTVPAIKGIEFGDGFGLASMKGSEANDEMYYDGDAVKCRTNHSGGITGGISNGMPLIIRCAVKPTPSIALQQNTVNLKTKQDDTMVIEGRHDPCIVPRALPAVEAAVALALLDLIAEVKPL